MIADGTCLEGDGANEAEHVFHSPYNPPITVLFRVMTPSTGFSGYDCAGYVKDTGGHIFDFS